ncbi:MAG: hypothetical protein ACON4N_07275 [Myxococcota bacterium]
MRAFHLAALIIASSVCGGCIELIEASRPTVIHEVPADYDQNWVVLYHNCDNGQAYAKGGDANDHVVTYPNEGMYFHSGPPFPRNFVKVRKRQADNTVTQLVSDHGGGGEKNDAETQTPWCEYAWQSFANTPSTPVPLRDDLEEIILKGCRTCRPHSVPAAWDNDRANTPKETP